MCENVFYYSNINVELYCFYFGSSHRDRKCIFYVSIRLCVCIHPYVLIFLFVSPCFALLLFGYHAFYAIDKVYVLCLSGECILQFLAMLELIHCCNQFICIWDFRVTKKNTRPNVPIYLRFVRFYCFVHKIRCCLTCLTENKPHRIGECAFVCCVAVEKHRTHNIEKRIN